MSVEKKEEVTTTVRYVVTLNEEEARALGALRYSHMDRTSALGKALTGLPEAAAGLPGIRRGGRIGEPGFRTKPELKKYKVQFKAHGSDIWGHSKWDVDFMPKDTRNEAFRVMRKRGACFEGWDPATNSNKHGSYRVVSADVKDGPEEDRGHYRVQFWSSAFASWKDCKQGPGFSGVKYFSTAAAAQAAINARGFPDSSYRVKWYPGEK